MSVVPLSLYIHIPWCVRKCEYCDFNSHVGSGNLPEASYIHALLRDLDSEALLVGERQIQTIFIGGGTPSLISGESIRVLLNGVRSRVNIAAQAEVTLEANPGTVDAQRFADYRNAGVNRLSIGVQSFRNEQLRSLGRIHDSDEAIKAFYIAREAGFTNVNLDLMYGLPGDSVEGSLGDLEQAVRLQPEHISWYQLTLEPNTVFYFRPPRLPDEEVIWEGQEAGIRYLFEHGYVQYEVSAYSQTGMQCRHNRNYWEFGDYLGIGAGAHGKLTDLKDKQIVRRSKTRHPNHYVSRVGTCAVIDEQREVAQAEKPVEFLMNALRLTAGVDTPLFTSRTGLALDVIGERLEEARNRQLIADTSSRLRTTPIGARYLNELLCLFM